MGAARDEADHPVTAWVPRPPHPDEPACWSWDVPPVRDVEQVIAAVAGHYPPDSEDHRDVGALRMAYYEPAVIRWQEFHAGVDLRVDAQAAERCAVCGTGARWPDRRLVDDHCHTTGQIRGKLCGRCNTREARTGGLVFERYRRVHPASILDAHEMYDGFFWRAGWDLRVPGPSGLRPPTPWPPFDLR